MADLYEELGGNSRRVLTRSDNSGPETTWLLVDNNNGNWEGGESNNPEPELTGPDSINYTAIVECIQTYCEVYEVVRANYNELAIKVRHSSVPYAEGESKGNGSYNTPLSTVLQAHPDLGNAYSVWNGSFRGNSISWD